MDNKEKQNEEILALQSIFEENHLFVDLEANPVRGRFLAMVQVPQNFFVTQRTRKKFLDADNNAQDLEKMKVEYLPPLNLLFELPHSYPSHSPPAFLLSSNWLSMSQISMLCKKLESIWKEGGGEVILFQWIQFLEGEVLNFLEITDALDISKLSLYKRWKISKKKKDKPVILHSASNETCEQTMRRTNRSNVSQVPKCNVPSSELGNINPKKNLHAGQMTLKPSVSGGCGPIDLRAMLDLTNGRLLFSALEEYNKAKMEDAFNDACHMCQICYKETKGSNFSRFKECQHYYCKECLATYFGIQIRDGNVGALNCPKDKCVSQADAMQVRELVDPSIFLKYDQLLLSRSLDTMSDVVYCPRKFCQSPVIVEQGSNMSTCPQCSFVFCIFCRMAYHGIAPCNFKSDEKRQIFSKYIASKGDEKGLMEKRYGKKALQFLVDNTLSEDWVESNSKRCPRCNASIEKTDGCNKMTCFRCGAYFCWLCQARLKATNPYTHFNDPDSNCYDKLFPAFAGIEDEEDFFPGEFLE